MTIGAHGARFATDTDALYCAAMFSAGCLKVARGPAWRRYPHQRPNFVQQRTSRLKLILF